jgi:gamma-glutamyl hercynylcysteine S-oxide hydrolase
MCRHLAYLGPPLPLAALLYEAPHALLHQSFAPRDMRGGGVVNADGFGVGWYRPGVAQPVRYRRDCPLWADANLRDLAAVTTTGAALAAVRNATAGMPVLETAAAPFTEGRWLFSHNGAVTGWPDSMTGLAGTLPTRDLLTLDAPTDAALLWALIRGRLRGGATLTDALVATLCDVAVAAPGSRLNFLATDGRTAVATTFGHALSVRRAPDAVLISSEPLDDEDDSSWHAVAQGSLVVASPAGVDIAPIPGGDTLPPPTPPKRRHKETR